jgi:putative SOS response-associated peptidase YedK
MCGRYSSTKSDSDIAKEFKVEEVVGEEPEASWNVAPTQTRRVVLEHAPKDAEDRQAAPRVLRSARWGLVPSWAKDVKIGSRLINARSETITEKPSFRAASARRRCLVPADGYFEWEKIDGRKVPQFLYSQTSSCCRSPGSTSCGPTLSAARMTRIVGCGATRSSPGPPRTRSVTSTTVPPSSFPPTYGQTG